MKLISFKISGEFAAFRDPSVTSNQTVYYVPSKSAIVGILSAMIGIERSNSLDDMYSEQYLNFFKNTKVGLQYSSTPNKITFFTNHRSLKEPKTKPFKKELVEKPAYTIYVSTDAINFKKLSNALEKNEFVYSPYLGHAYCHAIISDYKQIDASRTDPRNKTTQCIILDESEPYSNEFQLRLEKVTDDGFMIVERHMHHFFHNERFDARILKYWIPTNNSEFEINEKSGGSISEFYEVENHVICMF